MTMALWNTTFDISNDNKAPTLTALSFYYSYFYDLCDFIVNTPDMTEQHKTNARKQPIPKESLKSTMYTLKIIIG